MARGGIRPGAGRPRKTISGELKHTVRLNDSEKDFIDFSRIKKIDLNKLKKSLLVFFALILLALPCNSQTLTGGVEYTVDSARVIAFEDVETSVSTDIFKDYLKDLHRYSNVDYIKAGTFHAGIGYPRKLIPFYRGKILIAYGVQYDDFPEKKFYYLTTGALIKYEYNTFKDSYPYKTIAYDSSGKLLSIALVVSDKESYHFNSNKRLTGHWLNSQYYNEKGEKTSITRHF